MVVGELARVHGGGVGQSVAKDLYSNAMTILIPSHCMDGSGGLGNMSGGLVHQRYVRAGVAAEARAIVEVEAEAEGMNCEIQFLFLDS
ncbi:hypothetical protein HanXRQr2_Chr17g0806371 [Helianthus annuus]|uniref:Uncharacterized protein n=1 Tax=Helianthus annuus TaxID=4232 RepID=A0A9K3GUJ8_HELAN|nr:hypothetical protein HanXRQr2_Chr17g0806371 [Helianthus annuus]